MTGRIRLGLQSDGAYGLRISKPGQDVSMNPVNNELMIFNSDWAETLPLYTSGTFSVAAGPNSYLSFGTGSFSFASLGFVPFAIIARVVTGGYEFWSNKWESQFTTTAVSVRNYENVAFTAKAWVFRRRIG